jgi:hypothetical protein
MQTFLPYADFTKTAKILDNKRLGKSRVEVWQIYQVLIKGEFSSCPKCLGSGYWSESGLCEADDYCKKCDGTGKVKTPWYNHPAVRMYKNYEEFLLLYGYVICSEWLIRGYRDSLKIKFLQELINRGVCNIEIDDQGVKPEIFGVRVPIWFGNKQFHASHRSNLLRKNFEWYNKFGWTESNNLPYFWPV